MTECSNTDAHMANSVLVLCGAMEAYLQDACPHCFLEDADTESLRDMTTVLISLMNALPADILDDILKSLRKIALNILTINPDEGQIT